MYVKEPLALPLFAKYFSFIYILLGIFRKPVSKLLSLSKLHDLKVTWRKTYLDRLTSFGQR